MAIESELSTLVEASSLSAVTDIASDPPLHPDAATNSPWLPLVLYIARVPGSRDVFLTPLKPRDKVVSAEDVRSSLYYVHFNSVQDYEQPPHTPSSVNADAEQLVARPALPPRPLDPRPTDIARHAAYTQRPPLPKRPLPPITPPYPTHTEDTLLQQPRAPSPQKMTRKPLPNNRFNTASTDWKTSSDLPALPRRPLPTPPADEPDHVISLHDEKMRLLRHAEHLSEPNPYHYEYDPPKAALALDSTDWPDPGTLTLIRRDPSSNEQWNVASIHDPPVPEISSSALLNPTAARRTKKGGAPLYLDVTNPSYAQFLGPDRDDSRISTTTSDSADSDAPPEGVFRRRLYMPGSRFAEHGYRIPAHSKSGSIGSSGEEAAMRKSMRPSVDSSAASSAATTDRRTGGYTFMSPWDGRCEFATGATGRSLKCRHHLSGHNGGVVGSVTEVSELRFNLPTRSKAQLPPPSDKRSSYFSGGHRRLQSTDSWDGGSATPVHALDENGKLDLSLGQERAGGGFGGKQAKLGKLIIEPDGLKMLDLLVAANVALWWRAYERA